MVSGGVSNVSFSFRGNNPVREAIHAVFLLHAIRSGMDMGIVNPGMLTLYDDIDLKVRERIEDLLFNRREDATERLMEIASGIEGKKQKQEYKVIDTDKKKQSVEKKTEPKKTEPKPKASAKWSKGDKVYNAELDLIGEVVDVEDMGDGDFVYSVDFDGEINEYMDFEILGDIYSRGGWGIKPHFRYKKRYKRFKTVRKQENSNIINWRR
jgi:hypothetical protein